MEGAEWSVLESESSLNPVLSSNLKKQACIEAYFANHVNGPDTTEPQCDPDV